MPEFQIPILYWPLLLAGAYLLGSIPFAQVIARVKGIDLRHVGTGNVGAGNLRRQMGLSWAIVAAILDGLKGLVPVFIALRAGFGSGAAGLVGVASVIGHSWSVWLRGRSGRGLATSVGLLVALDPVLMTWTTGWAIAGWKFGGGLGGFLGWGLLPFVAIALGRPVTESLVLFLLAVVLMTRRAQGNADSVKGAIPALRRVIYDTDHLTGEYPDAAEDPVRP